MNKLIAVVAVSLLVLAGCTADTSYSDMENSTNVAVAQNRYTGNSEEYRLGMIMPVGEYYLTDVSDTFIRPKDAASEIKSEVPITGARLEMLRPYTLVNNNVAYENLPSSNVSAFYQDVAIYPVGYRPAIPADVTSTYAPGLYKVGTDIPAGSYNLSVSPASDQLFASYSVWSDANGDAVNLVEHKVIFGSRVVNLKNGEYLETSDAVITSR